MFAEDGKEILTTIPWHGVPIIASWSREAMRPDGVFTGKLLSTGCSGISLAPSGRFLASAEASSGTVYLWVRDRSISFREWSGLATGAALRVAFTPDSRRLLSPHQGWDDLRLQAAQGRARLARFPPSGPRLARPYHQAAVGRAGQGSGRRAGPAQPRLQRLSGRLGQDGDGRVVGVSVQDRAAGGPVSVPRLPPPCTT